MKLLTLDDLTEYHRKKVFNKALAWRKENHRFILELIRIHTKMTGPAPRPPTSSIIFSPEKWEAHHWIWFSEEIIKKIKKNWYL